LVKYDYSTTKQFICKSDPDTGEEFREGQPFLRWDFAEPVPQCSYAYHMPYDDGSGLHHRLSSASNPALAMAADRNPWNIPGIKPNVPTTGGGFGPKEVGNSAAHGREGQNVLFVDSHVEFSKTQGTDIEDRGSMCGLNDDDIYIIDYDFDESTPAPTKSDIPLDKEDAFLVNEGTF